MTAVEPRRGLRFEHARMRPSIRGVRFEDSPRSVCRVTKVDEHGVYYRTVDEDASTGRPWYIKRADFLGIVHQVLPDAPRAQRAPARVRVASVGGAGHWRAALRQGARTLVDCGHSHRNRDSGQGAARHCAHELVRAARHADTAARFVEASVYAAQRSRALGARINDDEARAHAEARVARWRDAVLAHDFHLPKPPGITAQGITCGCCRPTQEETP